ncbi:MAG: DNA translocase FtsK [Ruminococcaceae bacterium]|nr:DNA translocase FtsK [Oscillospiraceae bacterium]
MSEQKYKSQADKAAASKKKAPKKQAPKNAKKGNKVTVNSVPAERKIPVRFISSATLLGLFVLFLVVFFQPEGVVIQLVESVIHGLIGRAGFLVSIPALLYLFIIHAFSGGRPVKMRSFCIGAFVLICGCIAHLSLTAPDMPIGWDAIVDLYGSGIEGSSGGLVCGSIAMLFYWLFRDTFSYILLILGAIFTLLGGMQITLASIIHAIENRPRPNVDKKPVERQEPAAVVVNHIANKRIEHLEHKRERQKQQAAQAAQPQRETVPVTHDNEKVEDMFRQIDGDVDSHVTAANTFVPAPEEPEAPSKMPPFDKETALKEKQEAQVKRVKVEKVTPKEAQASAKEVAKEIENSQKAEKPDYCFPPIDLLKLSGSGAMDGTTEMRENSRRLNETLASFKIEAHIINVTRGPSVTRYEVELEKGVRLNKLTTAADDIALSLGATGVRIAAVPGKISVVGIEVPNRAVTMVSLREVIDSQEFAKAKSKSSFAVGKDIGGNCIVGNIARLPHMLIAGTTGSGKSVCMNSIIISLLYKASPDDVKLIMVDPKMVELGIYNGIPHLLIPVVTDPKKAAGSLQWAVSEMMRRYKAMSDAGVRDLESYNSMIESQQMEGKKIPQVVVIIDELADLMLVAAKEVEESICRIAQMGRASGIHLVIATQRPSADVITGLMKANIPSRIAFSVASAMESRIILDTQGAEKLVGKGDMLYAPIGNGKPKRVQGCFVSDSEVEAVASYVKANFVTNYDQEVMEEIEKKALQTGNKTAASDAEPNADELGGDEMLPAAVDVILETGQASVSMLQRRLKLGYARAARIVDEMEEKGIVGPFQGSKPRDILITKEQWAQMRSGGGEQMGFEDMEEFEESEDSSVPEDF